MNLRDALLKAAAFAATDQTHVRSAVLCVPPVFDPYQPLLFVGSTPLPTVPGFVLAMDEHGTGVHIHLDPDVMVPFLAVDAKELKKAVKSFKKEAFLLQSAGEQVAVLTSQSGAFVKMRAWPGRDFPTRPQDPSQFHGVSHAAVDQVQRVIHATLEKDQDRPELQYLHLTPWWVEATDRARVARSTVQIVPHGLLCPTTIWENWPKKVELGVSLGYSQDTLFVRVDEETRFAAVKGDEKWFNLSAHIPEKDHGQGSWFDADLLADAVKKARDVSDCDRVELTFREGSVCIAGVNAEQNTTISQTVLKCDAARESVRLVARGKFLSEALAAFPREYVAVFWTSTGSQIRFQDDDYVEVLWTMNAPAPQGGSDAQASN